MRCFRQHVVPRQRREIESHTLRIHIVFPALPPRLDGIGDYTANLAGELAKSAKITILTDAGPYAPIPGVTITPTFSPAEPRSLVHILPRVAADRPDWLLLQYNPFCYGHWGFNPHLPHALRALKRRFPETRLAIMAHEHFVPVLNWKWAVMTTWQRWQFWMLGRCADRLFFSIDPWARKFRKWFPDKPVLHLPVGSNIGRVCLPRAQARARLGIGEGTAVLGLFGTAHISRMLARAREAAEVVRQTGREVLVLYAGTDAEAVRTALGPIPACAEGPLPPAEVSRRLSAVDVYLAAFLDGISTRRTTLMAGLQHGLATVGTAGINTDDCLRAENGRAFLLSDANAPEAFNAHVLRLLEDAPLRARLGQEASRLYQREFAWDRIASRLLAALEANSPAIL